MNRLRGLKLLPVLWKLVAFYVFYPVAVVVFRHYLPESIAAVVFPRQLFLVAMPGHLVWLSAIPVNCNSMRFKRVYR